jgi:hypothetical protein
MAQRRTEYEALEIAEAIREITCEKRRYAKTLMQALL